MSWGSFIDNTDTRAKLGSSRALALCLLAFALSRGFRGKRNCADAPSRIQLLVMLTHTRRMAVVFVGDRARCPHYMAAHAA